MTQGAAGVPLIERDDLAPFADIEAVKAEAMIADAVAMATLAAPCITTTDFAQRDAVRAILRGAILRWNEAGTGALQTHSQTTGPWTDSKTVDNRQPRRGMFWPSEITQLQDLCKVSSRSAFAVDTAPSPGGGHTPWCNLMFGANYCSCGADLNRGEPLYEGGVLNGDDR